MDYTVEVTTKPVTNGDFTNLHRVLDTVPGSILIADPDEPVLIIPVEAESPTRAAMFVDGVAKLLELQLVSGKIGPAPADDFDPPDEDDASSAATPVVAYVQNWVAEVDGIEGRVTADGRLIEA